MQSLGYIYGKIKCSEIKGIVQGAHTNGSLGF